jgi:hypothetical protein
MNSPLKYFSSIELFFLSIFGSYITLLRSNKYKYIIIFLSDIFIFKIYRRKLKVEVPFSDGHGAYHKSVATKNCRVNE